MGIIKPVKAGRLPRDLRRPLRALLHKAAKGETGPYLELASEYFDFVSEYLYFCNLEQREILHQTENLLREGWQRLPYLKRLSDWERFLVTSLLTVPVRDSYTSGDRPQTVLDLEPMAKFALIAFDLEDWSFPWLALALRVQTKELTQLLFDARRRLLKIDSNRTPENLREHFLLVSSSFDGQLSPAQQRQAVKILCDCEQTRSFKSRWLAYRCHLIEIRQQIRLQPSERDQFLESVCQDLLLEKMYRPSIASRIRNLISFEALPVSEEMQDRPDLSYRS